MEMADRDTLIHFKISKCKTATTKEMKWKQNQDIHCLCNHLFIFCARLLYLRWGFMTVPIIFLTVCASHTQRLRSTAMVFPPRLCKWTCCLTGSRICHKSFTPILVIICCYLRHPFQKIVKRHRSSEQKFKQCILSYCGVIHK